ncbi:MAG: acylphosphatase [Actinobacteria bacterium]|nr:acylphosphatase [Actinomycetota bacterium]
MSQTKTYRLTVSGRVQGVGYRYFVEDSAVFLGVKGFVRNMPDNKVEIVCQGDEKSMEQFFTSVKKGPAFARVDEIIKDRISNDINYNSFEIKY